MRKKQEKEQLFQWIDENRHGILEEFKTFLRIPTLTGEEQAGQDFVGEKLRSLGIEPEFFEPDLKQLFELYPDIAQYPTSWQPELDLVLKFPDVCTWEQLQDSGYGEQLNYNGRPNVVGTLKGEGGGRSLILNGHVDVVTLGDSDKWTHDPFGAEQEGGRIFGRGASDMKSGLWSCITAMEAFVRCGVKLRGDLTLQSVVNEEHSGNGSLDCVAREYRADAAICAEPTGARRFADHSGGGVYWEIRTVGKEAHTGARWRDGKMNGVSAIEKIAPIICALREQERQVNREKTLFSLGVGVIQGGTYATATAAECAVSGVVYYSPELGVGENGIRKVKEMFRQAIAVTCERDPWLSEHPPELCFLHYDDAYVYPSESGFYDVFQNAAKELTGTALKKMDFSACDARHLGNRGGIPTLIYGPGEIGVAHAVDEYVDTDEIIEAIKVMAAVIYDWCS